MPFVRPSLKSSVMVMKKDVFVPARYALERAESRSRARDRREPAYRYRDARWYARVIVSCDRREHRVEARPSFSEAHAREMCSVPLAGRGA